MALRNGEWMPPRALQSPMFSPSPLIEDAPAPNFPQSRRNFGDILAEAVANNPAPMADRGASGGSQFLSGLVTGGLNGFSRRRMDAMQGRRDAATAMAERQQEANKRAVAENLAAREATLAEGKELKAQRAKATATEAGYIEVPPNVARLAGRPDMAGKRMPRAQLEALESSARLTLDERKPRGGKHGDDDAPPPPSPQMNNLNMRMDQMARRRAAVDAAINARDWPALKKLGIATFRDAQSKVAQLDADMAKVGGEMRAESLKGYTPGEILMAKDYLASRSLPGRNATLNARLAEAAAAIDPDADIAGNAADYAANKSSLTTLTRGSDSVEAFERTALANAERLLELIENIPETGNKPLNQLVRSGAVAMGDPGVNDFLAQVAITAPEFAKILGGGNIGGAALTDAARHEVKAIMDGSATKQQIRNIVALLKGDAGNRREAYKSTIGEVRGRLKGRGRGHAPASPAKPKAPKADDFWRED